MKTPINTITTLINLKGWGFLDASLYCEASEGTLETWVVLSTKGDGFCQTHKCHIREDGNGSLESGVYDMSFQEGLQNFNRRKQRNMSLFSAFESQEDIDDNFKAIVSAMPRNSGAGSMIATFVTRLQETMNKGFEE